MRTIVIVCLTGVALLCACSDLTSPGASRGFAIYTLQDTTLSASMVWDRPLESLVLTPKPFLTEEDITSYTWNTHEFTLTAPVDSQLAALKWAHGHTGGIPFVVVAGGERVYLGAFWYAYSSLIPQVPYIDVLLYPHRIWNTPNPAVSDDKRNDGRIYRVLKTAGVLIE
jgi:hypothetical protein